MAKVPTYDGLQVMPSAPSGARVRDTNDPQRATIGPRQTQALGAQLTQTGNTLANIELDAIREANQLRVDDAINKMKEQAQTLTYDPEEGYQNLRGVQALDRPDGKPLSAEYSERLNKYVGEIEGGLGNEAQQRAFRQKANDILTQFSGKVKQHEGAEYRNYALSVRQGTIANRLNEIGANYTDPEVIKDGLASIEAAAHDEARLAGKSAEWAEAHTREKISQAHMLVIASAMEDQNPVYADEYLKANARSMQADDILKIRGTLTKQMDAKVASGVVSKIMNEAQNYIETPEAERAFNIALNTESGGRQFAPDGTPTTSPKGAIGIAQVMPATGPEAAKLAGVDWDEEKFRQDPEYNRALGKAYFEKQLRDFNGNLAQAYAAYNAGPGRVREAIAEAERTEGATWGDFLPGETKNYVAKNMAAFEAGQGRNERPSLLDVEKKVKAEIGTDNPQRLTMALDAVRAEYKLTTEAIKQRDDAAVAKAMREVYANGGRFSSLPPSVVGALPADKVGTVMDFAKKVAQGSDTTSMWLYNKLESNLEELAKMSDDEFYQLRPDLSNADFKHFAQKRAELKNPSGTTGAGSLNSAAVKRTLDDRLRMAGLDPTPKDGSDDAARIGTIRQTVNNAILAEQQNTGKKMNDAEVTQFISELFAKTAPHAGMFGFTQDRMFDMDAGDIPGDTKKAIKNAFKARGISNPTDADILGAYWNSQIGKDIRQRERDRAR